MKRADVQKLEHGLYRVFWKSGGLSVAAVGSNETGERWLAPTNWINGPVVGAHAWRAVKRVELITTQQREVERSES